MDQSKSIRYEKAVGISAVSENIEEAEVIICRWKFS